MAFYLYQATYSSDAVKAMIAKPTDRAAAGAKLIEALGGKLHHVSFALGTYDLVVLVEAPDDKSMAAFAMAVGASGTVSAASTTKLIPMDEALEAMKLAGKASGSYRPPTA